MDKFNQQIHDYQLAGITNPTDKDIAEVAYIRLVTPLGSYFDDPTLGSKLYLLKRNKDLPRIRRQAVAWAKQALEPMREPFYLTDIEVWSDGVEQGKKGYFIIRAVLTTSDGSKHKTYMNVPVAG